MAFGHFGVDAFMIDAGVQTDAEMLLDNLAGNITNILGANTCIVRPLRSWIAALGEAKRPAVFIEEEFLLKSEPRARIVENGGAGIRGVRSDAVRHHNFAHDENAILSGGVKENRDWLLKRSRSFFPRLA